MINYSPKMLKGKFQKQFVSFILHAFLGIMMKSHAVPLRIEIRHLSEVSNAVYTAYLLVT